MIVQDEALFDFMVVRSRFAGLTEYEMDRNHVLTVDEANSPSSLPSFDIAGKKYIYRKNNHNRKGTEKKRATMYYCPPLS